MTKDSLVKQVRELLGQVKQKGFLQYRAAWDLSFQAKVLQIAERQKLQSFQMYLKKEPIYEWSTGFS